MNVGGQPGKPVPRKERENYILANGGEESLIHVNQS